MTIQMNRRSLLGATASAMAALAASGCSTAMMAGRGGRVGYGALVPDPAGFIDLPQGFTYRVLSKLGDTMSDGFTVPDAADGMGCFDIGGGKLAHFGLIEQVRQTVRNGGDVGGGKHHARHKFKPPVFVFRVS